MRRSLFVYRLVHAPVIVVYRAKAGFDSQTERAICIFMFAFLFFYSLSPLEECMRHNVFILVCFLCFHKNTEYWRWRSERELSSKSCLAVTDHDHDYRSVSAYAKNPTKVGWLIAGTLRENDFQLFSNVLTMPAVQLEVPHLLMAQKLTDKSSNDLDSNDSQTSILVLLSARAIGSLGFAVVRVLLRIRSFYLPAY